MFIMISCINSECVTDNNEQRLTLGSGTDLESALWNSHSYMKPSDKLIWHQLMRCCSPKAFCRSELLLTFKRSSDRRSRTLGHAASNGLVSASVVVTFQVVTGLSLNPRRL